MKILGCESVQSILDIWIWTLEEREGGRKGCGEVVVAHERGPNVYSLVLFITHNYYIRSCVLIYSLILEDLTHF